MNISNVWYTIFPKILNMSITASIVIVFVLAARCFLWKAPKIFSYVLWAVVLFRLICPFSFTIPFSLLNLTNPKSVENGTVVYVPEDIVYMGEPEVSVPVPVLGENISESINKVLLESSGQMSDNPLERTVLIMTYVWLSGILIMTGYSIFSVLRLKKRLVGAVKYKENIWIADHVYSSFVMGIFRPKIYLQSGLSPKEQEFVIMHEKIHLRRGDHLIKVFSYMVLTIHWFNPLVWLSYFLCIKDMEMSCDESVMKNIKEDVRADYSESLLSLAAGKKMFAGTPIFFGEGDTKLRIKNVLNYKKPAIWMIAAGIMAVVILCICFMGNPSDISADDGTKYPSDSTEVSAEGSFNYPPYPVYVRTMGPGSIGCAYGYCALEDRDEDRILEDLSRLNGFYFSNFYSTDVALFYLDEPREIKLYHALADNEEYEEYTFAGDDYQYPFGSEGSKYVIQLPKDYGMHYFFAVISWEDGSEDLMYFSMEYKYNPPSDTTYYSVTVTKNAKGTIGIKYPQLSFPSQTMDSFTVWITLPQGLFLEKRGSGAADIVNLDTTEITGTFLTTYFFDENKKCVGKMGCNYYELYEGAENDPQAIYNPVFDS